MRGGEAVEEEEVEQKARRGSDACKSNVTLPAVPGSAWNSRRGEQDEATGAGG